jgi:hypothetical protein
MTQARRNSILSVSALLFGVCGACAGLAAIAQTPGADDAKSAQEREKVDRELKELQDQRAKIDSRMRELRRQSGRENLRVLTVPDAGGRAQVWTVPNGKGLYFSDGDVKNMKDLTPEQRKKVEEAMAEAKRALEKARKELPEGFVMPNVEGLLDSALRWRSVSPNSFYVSPQAFDSKEFHEQMDKMREDIRRNVDAYRLAVPKVYAVPPAISARPAIPAVPGAPLLPPAAVYRGGTSPELRDEIRELRRELEQLREEMRRERGTKKSSDEQKSKFLEPFGATL